jgi:hypothetical protein
MSHPCEYGLGMTEIEELRAEVESLKKKLEDREMRLIRAWNGLVKIRGELQRFSAPHAYEIPRKSFEEQADVLAMGVTGMIQSYREKLCRMIESGRRIYAYVGREPVTEAQREDVVKLRKGFDLALVGLEEGRPYEGFYGSEMQAKRVATSDGKGEKLLK